MKGRERRYSWGSVDRRCSHYTWVINTFIAYSTKVRLKLEAWRYFSVTGQSYDCHWSNFENKGTWLKRYNYIHTEHNKAVCIYHGKYCTHGNCKWHDDVIKWKHFSRYWPFVRGIHRWPVNSPHKGQWRRALMFSLICTWNNSWANNEDAGDLRRHRTHYDAIAMGRLGDVNISYWYYIMQSIYSRLPVVFHQKTNRRDLYICHHQGHQNLSSYTWYIFIQKH